MQIVSMIEDEAEMAGCGDSGQLFYANSSRSRSVSGLKRQYIKQIRKVSPEARIPPAFRRPDSPPSPKRHPC